VQPAGLPIEGARQCAKTRFVVPKVFVNMPPNDEHPDCTCTCCLQRSGRTLGIGTTSPRIVNQKNGLGIYLASSLKLLLAVLVIHSIGRRAPEKALEAICGRLHCPSNHLREWMLGVPLSRTGWNGRDDLKASDTYGSGQTILMTFQG
jgi:hypothetical protein